MYDVAVIGGGVTGSAIARELSRYRVKACVIEREADLCEGTSKANSAIVHAGFDAKPGTYKAKMNVEGNRLMEELAKELDFPFQRNGSLVVCTKDQDETILKRLLEQGKKNGVPGLRIVDREELLSLEPNIADDVAKALYAPTGSIVCPFHLTYALAENASENGVDFFLDTEVKKLEKTVDGFRMEVAYGSKAAYWEGNQTDISAGASTAGTEGIAAGDSTGNANAGTEGISAGDSKGNANAGTEGIAADDSTGNANARTEGIAAGDLVGSATAAPEGITATVSGRSSRLPQGSGFLEAKIIVNAAGVYADVLNNMVSDKTMEIIPRRGQYMLLDKTAGRHVRHTIFQLPSKMGKGILVTPTIHGNLLVGPTAEEIENKEGVNTTAEGLSSLARRSALSVKNIPYRQVITSFAGLRAHDTEGDFIIGEAEDAPGFFNAAGIESPGLSSAPAIGVYLAKMVAKKLGLSEKESFKSVRKGILNPTMLSFDERNALIKEKPAYGQIICRCESISEGEILDAIHRPLGARTLDGVKRRTRAGMGRCQAGFCSPRVMEILERELSMNIFDIQKSGDDSRIVVGYNKKI